MNINKMPKITVALGLVLAAWGCGAGGADSKSTGGDHSYLDVNPGAADDAWQSADTAAEVPQEGPEHEFSFFSAAVGQDHVFIVDRNRDSVVLVNATDLTIRSVRVGDGPTLVKTLPGQDVALVLNAGSNTLSVVRLVDGQPQVTHQDVVQGANTLEVSPVGPYAVAWYTMASEDTTLGALNAVTVLRLDPAKEAAVEVATGFRPSAVTFQADGKKAFVVSRAGLTAVALPGALDQPAFSAPLPLVTDPLLYQQDMEVLVTPDGANAVSRVAGERSVFVLDVATRKVAAFELAGVPTDLDLVPGSGRIVATLREEHLVQLGDLDKLLAGEADALTPVSTGEQAMGLCRVSDDGLTALFYSTATDLKALARLRLDDLAAGLEFIPLQKSVRIVDIDPTSRFGVIYHDKLPGTPQPGDDEQTKIDKQWGFSVLDLASSYVLPFITAQEPRDLVFLADQGLMFVLLPDPQGTSHEVRMVNFDSFQGKSFTLYARPLTIQALPGTSRVVVLEEHVSGRVTFLDGVTSGTQSVTGFQLNAEE
jgi:DNA-binding beta-propeller fold protein YncE